MPVVTYLEAIRQGVWEEMERDPTVFCLGEDIGIYGGAFKVTDGFIDRFGPERVIDTPIAESAIIGSSVTSSGVPPAPSSAWSMTSSSLLVSLPYSISSDSQCRSTCKSSPPS